MRRKELIILAFLFLCFGGLAQATIVDITVATNKPVYQLGEYVTISITAYNPNPEPVTLTTGFYFTSYIMDGVYDWLENHLPMPLVVRYTTIQPYEYFTESLTHDFWAMEIYPLEIGIHTVMGQVLATELVGNNQSLPVEFEVVPEPSMIVLFGFALPILRIFAKRKM